MGMVQRVCSGKARITNEVNMKKFIIFLLLCLVLVFLYFMRNYNDEVMISDDIVATSTMDEEDIMPAAPQIVFDEEVRKFDTSNLQEVCNDDPAICAVDAAVRCTINPKLEICDKRKLPRFIFMEDSTLGRPTKIDYTIIKSYPINKNTVEVQTKSSCDGIWFGLCEGNVIYVVDYGNNNEWTVKEIYALETY